MSENTETKIDGTLRGEELSAATLLAKQNAELRELLAYAIENFDNIDSGDVEWEIKSRKILS